MKFKNRNLRRLNDSWERNLAGHGCPCPKVSDQKLPATRITALKTETLSYYARIPSDPITILVSPEQDCKINCFKLADDWCRGNFLPTILFPFSITEYYEPDWIDPFRTSEVLHSTKAPAKLEAAVEFLKLDVENPKRHADLIIQHLLNCDTLLELCCILLNCKKTFPSSSPLIPLVMTYGFGIINSRQALFHFEPNGKKEPYWNKINYFHQVRKVTLPEYLEDFLEIRPVYKEYRLFRNMVWCKPNPKPDHPSNRNYLIEDIVGDMWELYPLKPFFSNEGCIYEIVKVENSEFTRSTNPEFRGLEYSVEMNSTGKTYATCLPEHFSSDSREKMNIFSELPSSVLVLDNNLPKDKVPNHFDKKIIQVVPLIVNENQLKFLIFSEKTFAAEYCEDSRHIFNEDSNMLTIFTLSCKDTSFMGPDNLLPKTTVNFWYKESPNSSDYVPGSDSEMDE